MIYIKKIINQDLERTPTFNIESIKEFFKINLNNGEDLIKKIKISSPEKIFNVKFQKRETRDEYRVFLSELFDEMKPNVEDILIFRKLNQELYSCEHISKLSKSYEHLNYLFEERNNHQLIVTDYEIDNKINFNPQELKEEFVNWFIELEGKNHNYYSNFFGSNRTTLIEKLNYYETIYSKQFGTPLFDVPSNGIDLLIEELYNNLYLNVGDFYDFSSKTSNHLPRAILGKKHYIKFLREIQVKLKTNSANSPKVLPVNKIYFGSPGTGKSFQITQDLKDVDLVFQKRITFHPEYDNASFVGGYKPKTENGEIKYEFVPQIFTNIFVEACNDPAHQYYLIIEEINRGNCAEIFGELFQLLDRDKNYKITPSNELIKYLNDNISKSDFYQNGQMLLPDNLSILATMNTSDQSLYPMDSAFKRRWEWEYIPIDYSKKDENKSALYKIRIDENTTVEWIEFIEKINERIKGNKSLGMDKCLGNYFIKPNENNEISLEKFIFKVIFYLWNDVYKDEPRDSVFGDKSYQDFFPVEEKGKDLVLKILKDLKISVPVISNVEAPKEA